MPPTRPSEYAVEFDINYNYQMPEHRCVYLAGKTECLKLISRLADSRYTVVNIRIWRSDSTWKDITLDTAALDATVRS